MSHAGRASAGRRTAFTLVEVLVVVVLTALLAAAASLTLLHAVRRGTAQDVLRRMAELDAVTRQAARRSGRAMEIVLAPGASGGEHGVAARQRDGDGQDTGTAVRLPSGAGLVRVWLWPPDGRDARTLDWGDAVVPCSALGLTPTYGFELAGPDGRHRWRVVAGLSGNVTEATDEAELLRTFKALAGDAVAGDAPAGAHPG